MANIWYAHFDSTPDDKRVLIAEDWAKFNRSLYTDGIRNGGDCLEVTAGSGLSVNVNAGIATIQGYLFRIDEDENGKTVPLMFPVAHQTLNRIDRVVLRLDRRIERREIIPAIIMGTPAANPVPPALTRNQNIWEISLARVYISATRTYILQTDITDERFDNNLCGIINSLFELDSSSWQTQVNTQIGVHSEEWNSRLNGKVDEWNLALNDRTQAFDAWIADVEQTMGASAVYDFENVMSRRGTYVTTSFGENVITMEIKNSNTHILLARRIITFQSNGEILTEEVIFSADGTKVSRFSDSVTSFSPNGTIQEVIL